MEYRKINKDSDELETDEEEERWPDENYAHQPTTSTFPQQQNAYAQHDINFTSKDSQIDTSGDLHDEDKRSSRASDSRTFLSEDRRSFQIGNPQRRSVQLPHLQVTEQYFFDLVEKGDVDAVKEFLLEVSLFNINCTNFQGLTALHVAMENNNEPMVNFLLQQKNLDVTDCALHAIRYNQPEILNKILDRLKEISPELEHTGCVYSPDFSMNMTPLILAAQCGNFEIIRLLILRGHMIPRPHKPNCFCPEECLKIMQTEDALLMITAILDVYRALANPAYICQISHDPILHAFKLSEELKSYARINSIFKKEFLKIENDVELFAAELLGCCRSCEEVNTLLSQSEGSRFKGNQLPRLILAMNLQQKQFVANSNIQQVLEITLLGDWYKWNSYPILIKVLITIPRIFMLPFIMGVCIIAPRSKLANFCALPINRMINHAASYLIFLLLLFIQSNKDNTDQRKKIEFTGCEIPISIFVVSFIWKDFRMCVLQGFKQFFRFRWNIFKVATDAVFVIYFIFFISAYLQVETLSDDDQELERKYWHYSDPQLIAEALFAIATIMSFFQLLLLIQVQENIGPLQFSSTAICGIIHMSYSFWLHDTNSDFIQDQYGLHHDTNTDFILVDKMFRRLISALKVSLGKMLIDCVQYAILFIIIVMSFTTGLGRLYSYYNGMSQVDPDSHLTIRQETPFTGTVDTLKFLFWGLFSVSDPDSANVIIENTVGEDGKPSINQHYITEALGYYAFAIYMVLTVIIVLNMMIGTMANTYNRVIDNADVEWVFERTEVYLAYLQESVMPPPFNLLPSHAGFTNCKESFRKGFCGRLFSMDAEDKEKAKIYKEREQDYPKLMTLLVQRYFRLNDKDEKFWKKRPATHLY